MHVRVVGDILQAGGGVLLGATPRASTVWTAEREKACAAALQAASYAAVVVKTGN